jgi:hypothetical protein
MQSLLDPQDTRTSGIPAQRAARQIVDSESLSPHAGAARPWPFPVLCWFSSVRVAIPIVATTET